jgi:hypothetical protein
MFRSETHYLAAERQKKNEKFKQALGIDADYVEGSAFNADYQEMQKQKRKVYTLVVIRGLFTSYISASV